MADEAHEHISVAASPEHCFAIATDYERYPEWAKDVKHAAVLERDPEGRASKVEYRVAGLGKSIRYVLSYDYGAAPGAFSWQFVEGDTLRRLDGRYGFEPEGSGTRVTYDLAVEIAIPMPGLIKRRAAGMIMGTALKELKKEAEAMTESLRDDIEEPVRAAAEEPAVEEEPLRAVPEDPARVDADELAPDDANDPRPGFPPPSAIESVVSALLEAGPEVAEHIVRSAQELLLAAQCVVDAAHKAVQEQQDLRRGDADTSEPAAARRHLDLAE
jgi:ribosome-associated toxin RatA of RatAB toxin-antitoxin module